jgi:hypothetical protein
VLVKVNLHQNVLLQSCGTFVAALTGACSSPLMLVAANRVFRQSAASDTSKSLVSRRQRTAHRCSQAMVKFKVSDDEVDPSFACRMCNTKVLHMSRAH